MRLLLMHLGRTWKLPLVAALVLFCFQGLVLVALAAIGPQMPQLFSSLLPKAVQAAIGFDRLPFGTPAGFVALTYQHPFHLALMFAIPIAVTSGLLAGEVERKTLALLLARPVGRVAIVCSVGFACVIWSLLLTAAAMSGTLLGIRLIHIEPSPSFVVLTRVAANVLLLALSIGAVSLVLSAAADERGKAVARAVSIVLAMYVWSFLAQLWPPMGPSAPCSLFHYYRPITVLIGSGGAGSALLVLACVTASGFACACAIYRWRDFRI